MASINNQTDKSVNKNMSTDKNIGKNLNNKDGLNNLNGSANEQRNDFDQNTYKQNFDNDTGKNFNEVSAGQKNVNSKIDKNASQWNSNTTKNQSAHKKGTDWPSNTVSADKDQTKSFGADNTQDNLSHFNTDMNQKI